MFQRVCTVASPSVTETGPGPRKILNSFTRSCDSAFFLVPFLLLNRRPRLPSAGVATLPQGFLRLLGLHRGAVPVCGFVYLAWAQGKWSLFSHSDFCYLRESGTSPVRSSPSLGGVRRAGLSSAQFPLFFLPAPLPLPSRRAPCKGTESFGRPSGSWASTSGPHQSCERKSRPGMESTFPHVFICASWNCLDHLSTLGAFSPMKHVDGKATKRNVKMHWGSEGHRLSVSNDMFSRRSFTLALKLERVSRRHVFCMGI